MEIELGGIHGKGIFTLIDDDMFDTISQHNWFISGRGYAFAYNPLHYAQHKQVRNMALHRFVMDFPNGIVDHKNRNKLDNRKENLRVVGAAQNSWNQDINSRNTTGYRGVSPCPYTDKFNVSIMVNGVRHRIGRYLDVEVAGRAWDVAAIEYYGEYAVLNFPDFDYTDYVSPPGKVDTSSEYRGVEYVKKTNKWNSRIQLNNKRIFIGQFFTEEDAAIAQDIYIIRNGIDRKLNFPSNDYSQATMPATNQRKKSNYIGVSPPKREGGGWIAKLSVDGKTIHLGMFETELDAALAYNKYVIENGLNKKINTF